MSADEENTKKMEQKLRDVTDCCICLETYSEPRILPCIHTFCLNCLEKAGAKTNRCPEDQMPCPICRKEFTIPEKGFSGLQKNFFMDRMVEIRKALSPSDDRILCDLCSEDLDPIATSEIPSAEVYCVDCQQKLCQECCRHHRKSKLSKHHKIIALEGQMVRQDCIGAALPTFCDQHNGKVLEIYCSVCQEVVCAECFFKLHKTHDGLHVNTVIDGFRERIQESTQNFPGYVRDLIKMQETSETDMTAFVQKADIIEIQIATAREELEHLVDEHSAFLLSQIRSVKHKRLKDAEIQKGEIETLLASLESYETYCNQITTMGSASDVCRVADHLCKRAQELSDMYVATIPHEPYVKEISLRKTEFQDIFDLHDKNIIGQIEECQVPTTDPEGNTNQLHISIFEETITEPESSTEGESVESDTDIVATTKALNEELVNERLHADELKEERNMLTDRILECELKEQMFIKRVEDLERQLDLLRCLAYGEEKETKDKGNIDWDVKTAAVYTRMEAACDPTSIFSVNYRVYGIAILDNELFIIGSDRVVVVNELKTLKFKRRWVNPIDTQLSDVKHCNTNKCLYMLCDSIPKPNIARVDRNGNILLTWPVRSTKGQISVTNESNILLTTSFLNESYSNVYQLFEYTPDGDLIQSIPLPWNSGFELASHAIKLTSDHFVVCHGIETSALVRICLVDKTGTVLKYYGDKWNRVVLAYPLCMDIDSAGNLLVADNSKRKVLLFNSNLDFKRSLIDHSTTHPKYGTNMYVTKPTKICIDEQNGRIFIVENVWRSTKPGETHAQQCDEITVYTLRT